MKKIFGIMTLTFIIGLLAGGSGFKAQNLRAASKNIYDKSHCRKVSLKAEVMTSAFLFCAKLAPTHYPHQPPPFSAKMGEVTDTCTWRKCR